MHNFPLAHSDKIRYLANVKKDEWSISDETEQICVTINRD